ncbi:hypothetical protein [uncultured Porphyromonas sp.]|uniref:hypothetical protein n=1 Tax=uncultured Porphyromonas sp. TaxID=159274 RepID=UPI0026227C3F|nr:hypothetical protein [uncultured Porphyromonas sp.]
MLFKKSSLFAFSIAATLCLSGNILKAQDNSCLPNIDVSGDAVNQPTTDDRPEKTDTQSDKKKRTVRVTITKPDGTTITIEYEVEELT